MTYCTIQLHKGREGQAHQWWRDIDWHIINISVLFFIKPVRQHDTKYGDPDAPFCPTESLCQELFIEHHHHQCWCQFHAVSDRSLKSLWWELKVADRGGTTTRTRCPLAALLLCTWGRKVRFACMHNWLNDCVRWKTDVLQCSMRSGKKRTNVSL